MTGPEHPEAERLLAELRGRHTRYPDSPHCKHDGERWPCLTLRALDAPTEAAYTPEADA
ncbi:hypothetical protein [Streptomyces sp. SPB074]|uniref:hypothetical protein n=1 Tax=Streptomyces sp. (strain SPB074) TaxID=465543 RepID=UPI00017F292F|nr:hypothetical protein [Streptomyces sp. SPB074]EDY43912.1 hypothetical protein SSBG_02102 [Streptomyces sp. SPB074]